MLTTFPHEECMESSARSSTYKSTALSSGRVEVKLKPKSIRTYKDILMDCNADLEKLLLMEIKIKTMGNLHPHASKEKIKKESPPVG